MKIMRHPIVSVFFTTLFLLAWHGAASTAWGDNLTWTVESRQIPPPAAVSKTIHSKIANEAAPNVTFRQRNIPSTDSAWLALAARQKAAKSGLSLAAMQTQFNVAITRMEQGDTAYYVVTPNKTPPNNQSALMLYFHGGAYVFNSGEPGLYEAAIIASYSRMTVWSVDYRMPPQNPFPAGLNDAITVYRHALATLPNTHIALGGTSAGAGLAMATIHQLKDLSLPLPKALYLGTPWADATKTGDTLFTLEGIDRVLVTYDGILGAAAKLYADSEPLDSKFISPIYGDFSEFPPTYLVSGTRDLFLSDTVRTHRKLRQASVYADLNIYEGLSHAEYLQDLDSIESQSVYLELSSFLQTHLSP